MTTESQPDQEVLGTIPLDTRDLVEEKPRKKRSKAREGPLIKLPMYKNAINFLKNVGPEAIGIFGAHGSGKSNLAHRTAHNCLRRGDCVLYKADSFSEWRHLLNHGSKKLKKQWKINLLIPDPSEVDLFFFPAGNLERAMETFNLGILKVPLDDFTPETVMSKMKSGEVLAVYDSFIKREPRTLFWAELSEHLVSRRILNDVCVTWVDNEASLLAPVNARKKHNEYIVRLAEAFIEFRKALVRPIWVCQVETELDWKFQKKIPWRMYPGDLIPVGDMPRGVKRQVIFSKRGKLIIVHGGKYRKGIKLECFEEYPDELRIIPPLARFNYGGSSESNTNNQISHEMIGNVVKLRLNGFSYRDIGKELQIDHTTAYGWLKRMGLTEIG